MSDAMQPPRFAMALATIVTAPADREFVLGDLEESYRDAAERYGSRAAGSECVVDILASVPSLLILRLARLFRRDPRGSFMSRLMSYLLPPAGRHFAYWLAFCISIAALASVTALWWPNVVDAIAPGTTYDVALSLPWALGMFAIQFLLVAAAIGAARANSGPRWLWLPLAITAGATTLFSWASTFLEFLQQNVLPAGPGVFNYPLTAAEIASRVGTALWPVAYLAAPAFIACLTIGDRREGMFGERPERRRVIIGSIVAAAGTFVSLAFSLFSGFVTGFSVLESVEVLGFAVTIPLVLTLIAVCAATLFGTLYAGLPRAAWLAAAVPGAVFALAALLSTADLSIGLIVSALVSTGLVAVAALMGAIAGSALAERKTRAYPAA